MNTQPDGGSRFIATRLAMKQPDFGVNVEITGESRPEFCRQHKIVRKSISHGQTAHVKGLFLKQKCRRIHHDRDELSFTTEKASDILGHGNQFPTVIPIKIPNIPFTDTDIPVI